jgi:hypothetical protein
MRILRGISSRRLACGCLVGIYETYDAKIVAVVDSRGEACDRQEHVRDRPLAPASGEPDADAPGDFRNRSRPAT